MTEDFHCTVSVESRALSRADVANQTTHACDICGAPISNLSCYGWWDYGDCEGEAMDADLVHCCWKCRKEMEAV